MRKSPFKGMINGFRQFFSAFDRWAEPQEGDTQFMLAMRVVIKYTGIVLMILLSPFLVIGLTIAFIAVF